MATLARNSREQDSRESEVIHDVYADSWEETGLLDTKNIPARPGYVQRWIRTSVRGDNDQSNVFRKINQGWKPRALDSVPKGAFVPNIDFNGSQVIGIHGMILMERPAALQNRHAEHVKQMTDLQMTAVEKDLYGVHDPNNQGAISAPTMRVESSYGRGRVPTADDD